VTRSFQQWGSLSQINLINVCLRYNQFFTNFEVLLHDSQCEGRLTPISCDTWVSAKPQQDVHDLDMVVDARLHQASQRQFVLNVDVPRFTITFLLSFDKIL